MHTFNRRLMEIAAGARDETEIPKLMQGKHMLMDMLREADSVAFVRFASVYKEFREAEDFEKFIVGELAKEGSAKLDEDDEDEIQPDLLKPKKRKRPHAKR